MTRFGPTRGLICGRLGSGVMSKRYFASGLSRFGSIMFGIPLYVNGCRDQSLAFVVNGS